MIKQMQHKFIVNFGNNDEIKFDIAPIIFICKKYTTEEKNK